MDWIKAELLTGFQRLLTLGLERQPAAEVIPGTVATWFDTLTTGRLFEQERDTPRFRAAFRQLAGRLRTWPAPVDFLDALPRIEMTHSLPRLDSDASRERGIRALAEIAEKLKIDPVKPHSEVEHDSAT